ncbi:MAG: PilT/PilU family type 4a pilus ATPase [Desulfoferrobacter sp.]
MSELYDMARMLGEIIEDEKVDSSTNRKVSQEEIKNILLKKKRLPTRSDDPAKIPLGESLVQEGLLTPEQLQHALKIQARRGQKLGSILVGLGYIGDDALLKFLGRQYGIETSSLVDVCINEDVMGVIPSSIVLKHRVLPMKVEARSINLAMESPNDFTAIREVEFFTGKRVNPVIVPSYHMDLAIQCLKERGMIAFSGIEIQQVTGAGPPVVANLLQYLVGSNGSDMLITADVPPSVKVSNSLKRVNMPPISADQCVAYAKALMNERQWEDFLKSKEIDFAIEFDNIGRFRINVYRQKDSVSLAIRRITNTILSFASLGLPDWLEEFVLKPQGLLLVTAPTGHGKTTTVAALIGVINKSRRCNIITLEDPIEYVHQPQKSNINQREVGSDTNSFSEGLRRIFRQAPDVIVIGELRDQETFEIALRAASTGHLVLSTMHSNNATSTIDSMVNRFPQHLQGQVRHQLAEALLLVFSQRLVVAKKGDTLLLAYEKLINSFRIRNFIRENKTHQIRSQIQTEADDFASLDVCLNRLLREGKISTKDALLFAENPDFVTKVAK